MAERLALVIAVETYQDSAVPPAAHAESDALAFARAVEGLGFAREDQLVLTPTPPRSPGAQGPPHPRPSPLRCSSSGPAPPPRRTIRPPPPSPTRRPTPSPPPPCPCRRCCPPWPSRRGGPCSSTRALASPRR